MLFARLEADGTLRFVNLDYVLKRGADPHGFKEGILRMLDDHGVEYPAEHNVGHLYTAKPQLAAFYRSRDPLARLNPGVGGTPWS